MRRRAAGCQIIRLSTVKLPEIWPEPPVIGPRMRGAEITLRRARWQRACRRSGWSPGRILTAANVELEIHHRFAGARIKARLGIVRSSPCTITCFSTGSAPVVALRQHVDIGGLAPGSATRRNSTGRGAENILQPLRILQAGTSTTMRSEPSRWMFGSVVPSASTRRFSTSIDWSNGAADGILDVEIGDRHLNEAVGTFADVVERAADIAEHGSASRLAHLPQSRHQPAAVAGIGHPELDGAVLDAMPPVIRTFSSRRRRRTSSRRLLDDCLRHIGAVDLEQQMRAACQSRPSTIDSKGNPARKDCLTRAKLAAGSRLGTMTSRAAKVMARIEATFQRAKRSMIFSF